MNIKQLRTDLASSKTNRTHLAFESGVSRSTIQRIVADVTYNPTLKTLKLLERQLRKEQAKRDKVSA